MRIQIMSDVHFEFWYAGSVGSFLDECKTDADCLILAGDACSLQNEQDTFDQLSEVCKRYKHVVYVPGNHEFYDVSIDDGLATLARVAALPGCENLHVLHPTHGCTIDGQVFKGGTMWQPADRAASRRYSITDHRLIRGFEQEAPKQYQQFYDLVYGNLLDTDIVVSHHAPSNTSISSEWIGSPYNRWFITPEMDSIIHNKQPKLWVHGHVHSDWDYKLSNTRVVCNPRGYPNEGVRFNPKLVIDI